MFGEMIGLALAQTWLDQGAPTPVALIELGPGRGTLMADILRATRAVPGFHGALQVHLVEASPTLRAVQARTLCAVRKLGWMSAGHTGARCVARAIRRCGRTPPTNRQGHTLTFLARPLVA